MSSTISAGKFRRLQKLADRQGRFQMLAVDQRGSMVQSLAEAASVTPDEISHASVAEVKRRITAVLSPSSTATLIDPDYGYPYAVDVLDRDAALLLTSEEYGYEKAGPRDRERRTRLIQDWDVAKAACAGADAIKLLLYYRPDASAPTLQHQQEICRQVGLACVQHDLPFLLELVAYPVDASSDSPAYAREKPKLLVAAAKEFSQPHYGVDVLKLPFPAELKYTTQFAAGAFDDRQRDPVYDLDAVRQHCRDLDEAAAVPWVILSAGVQIAEFLENLRLACTAGASGFLCGRAIWSSALDAFPDLAALEQDLAAIAMANFRACNELTRAALPWTSHRRFAGSGPQIAQRAADWYKVYHT